MMIIGHRCGKGLGPENTITTMKRSFEANADGIEVDVRLDIDDKPIVIHDETIDRTTTGSGDVSKLPLDAIQKFDAGEGTKVPGLVDVLEELSLTNKTIFIDIKDLDAALPAAKIADHFIMGRGCGFPQIVIISMYHQLLARIHEQFPKLHTGAGIKKIPDSLAACAEFTNSRYILPPLDEITDAFVADAKSRNVKVIPWVCDSDEDITKAKTLGVDGIMTSDPKKALALVA